MCGVCVLVFGEGKGVDFVWLNVCHDDDALCARADNVDVRCVTNANKLDVFIWHLVVESTCHCANLLLNLCVFIYLAYAVGLGVLLITSFSSHNFF